MERVSVPVKDQKGKDVGSVELDAKVFGAEIKPHLVHQVVRWQLAKRRAGTHSTLTRTMMKGGGAKPFKQKGTGRARAGSNISPLWVGGAVVFGPQPRDYTFRLGKKEKRAALRAVLSSKLRQGKLLIVNDLSIASGKTKDMAQVLRAVGVDEGKGAAVLLTGDFDVNSRPVRNLDRTTPLSLDGINVYDMMKRPFLVCSQEGILALQERLVESSNDKSSNDKSSE